MLLNRARLGVESRRVVSRTLSRVSRAPSSPAAVLAATRLVPD